jgi:hypothetical protein
MLVSGGRRPEGSAGRVAKTVFVCNAHFAAGSGETHSQVGGRRRGGVSYHTTLARRFTPAGFSLVIAAGAEPLMVWLSFQHSLGRLPPPVE